MLGGVGGVREEDERRVAIRIKLCGECGARHVAGTCPFTRPTHVLPDSCPPPNPHAHEVPQQNGVIVAPPHRESPVNLSGGGGGAGREEEREVETWRDPQRPGSPTSYARTSLPPGLALERRVLPPPSDNNVDSDNDVGVVGVTQIPGRQVEVVVARAAITRYTQLGPVVGVPVRERDIPDDFCMVNLWEVSSPAIPPTLTHRPHTHGHYYLFIYFFFKVRMNLCEFTPMTVCCCSRRYCHCSCCCCCS